MFGSQEAKLNDACHMGDNILSKCSPDAVTVVKHWITVLQARWEEVSNLSHQREERLSDALVNLKDNARLLEDLLQWLEGAENTIQGRDAKRVPDDIPVIQKLLEEHQVCRQNVEFFLQNLAAIWKNRTKKIELSLKLNFEN